MKFVVMAAVIFFVVLDLVLFIACFRLEGQIEKEQEPAESGSSPSGSTRTRMGTGNVR